MPMWLIYALLSAFFAALVAIFGKVGLAHMDATFSTTVRSIIMAVFLIIVVAVQGKWGELPELLVNKKSTVFIVLSGLAGALSWLCYFLAIQGGEISKVAPIDKLSAVFAVIFAIVFLGETLSFISALGVVAISVGALMVALG